MRPLTDDQARDRLMNGCGAAVMAALARAHAAEQPVDEQQLADRTMCHRQAARRYALLAVRVGWAVCVGAGFVATDDGARIGRAVGIV